MFKKKKEDDPMPKNDEKAVPTQEEKPIDEAKKFTVADQLKEVNEKLDIITGARKEKPKKIKLKGFAKGKLKEYNKKKKRPVLLLKRQGGAELLKGEYCEGMIKLGENYYDASAMYVWLFKDKHPFYVIPEWSVRPLCREEVYKKSKEDNTLIDSQVITLRAMKLEQTEKNKGMQMGGLMWIGIAIAGIVVIWLMFGGK